MTKRMLIDATHTEETRVVVLDGSRLEDFDVETSSKKQLKGNIYLAKIVRVEPSLQAAFVEYGGNRHGFLAFGEIHPDYYQIPVADRQRLLAMQEEEARREDEAEGRDDEPVEAFEPASGSEIPYDGRDEPVAAAEPEQAVAAEPQEEAPAVAMSPPDGTAPEPAPEPAVEPLVAEDGAAMPAAIAAERRVEGAPAEEMPAREMPAQEMPAQEMPAQEMDGGETAPTEVHEGGEVVAAGEVETVAAEAPPPETVGGDEEPRERRIPQSFLRNYKIQEVIRRRQIILVQVVKEERGGKGAALTTYISLAGRFCVLMPNSPRGGGISRKITAAADRRRLKEITAELDIPRGMGLIVRTAGAARPKPEIRRDCEYLLRLWDDIRDTTLASVAPALIHEEASLIKRAIRDVYSRDVDEVVVDGEAGWQAAHDYMRMLMPGHQRKVIAWREAGQPGGQPLFAKHQVEAQLDAMLSPNVQLRSGGYLVINQTEALVAIDVNSGRSTRERGIEETAVRTNLEAADEVARQLRLRDLAGLIVIDFIDMESKKHNAQVERRLKDGLKNDRARIQVGHISHFGLMEMSRQRLRPSLAETSFIACPHCEGTGHVRGTESAAIHVLRRIEEEGAKRQSAEVMVHTHTAIALYILNHKRDRLIEMERRYGMKVMLAGDDALVAPQIRLDRLRAWQPGEAPQALPVRETAVPDEAEEAFVEDAAEEVEAVEPEARDGEDGDQRKRKRRKRRRGGKREDGAAEGGAEEARLAEVAAPDAQQPDIDLPPPGADEDSLAVAAAEGERQKDRDEGRSRRRGRRGGRHRRGEDAAAEAEAAPPPYLGPTPADPFGSAFDLFDVLEQAEQATVAIPIQPLPPPVIEPAAPVAAEPAAEPLAAAGDVVEQAGHANGAAEPVEAEPVETMPVETVPMEAVPMEAVPMEAVPMEAVPMEAAAEPVSEPAVKPMLVGEAEPAEKRRGWWRR